MSDSKYHTQKEYMVKQKSKEDNLSCAYMVDYIDNPTFWYTNIDKGHFNIPKIIWGNGSTGIIIDYKGEYGLTQFCYAIVDDISNLESIKKAMKSDKFIKDVMLFKNGLGDKYNRKIISLFRKDFWKEFI